jgi:hypothetical protein
MSNRKIRMTCLYQAQQSLGKARKNLARSMGNIDHFGVRRGVSTRTHRVSETLRQWGTQSMGDTERGGLRVSGQREGAD